jgi:2-polyprenyl-6-methoxyphenol hydroxylase-like FAD-dependent oxidoreductase
MRFGLGAMAMADVVVAGGGLVGQITALMLARRGHHIITFDSDADPPDGTAEDDFFGWVRPGVPQGHHGHVWRGRVSRVLREEAPDVVDAMLAHGIAKAGFDFGEGFESDFALMSRRPVFEAVVRRVVRQEPRVEIRTGQRVLGLTAAPGNGVPRVEGVRVDGGERVRADLVIDACGRRSMAPKWLAEVGAGIAMNHYQPCDLHYFARHYRLQPGAAFPNTTFPDGAFPPYGVFLAMAQDNGTFCLAGGLSKADPFRPGFRNAAAFDRVMAALPGMQTWAAVGDPITDVQLMGGLANRRRSLVDHGQLTVEGYVLVGDASLYTNATFGQGVALGFWQAQALAARSDLIGRNNPALVRSLETWTDQTLGPRYAAQVRVDEAMVKVLHEGVAGAPAMRTKDRGRALRALMDQDDSEAAAAFYRIDNLLTSIEDELADPGLRSRVEGFLDTVEEGPAGPGPLPRADFEALIG